MLVGAFFVLILFIGVIVDNFRRERDQFEGIGLMTDGQQEWFNIRLSVFMSVCVFMLTALFFCGVSSLCAP